jgi:hypothetical protein
MSETEEKPRQRRGTKLVSRVQRSWSDSVLSMIGRNSLIESDEGTAVVLLPPPLPTPQRPPQLVQQVQARMLTFDELADKIGHRPHQDRLGGQWKRSTEYKAIRTEIGQVNALSGASLADGDFDALDDQLDALIAAAGRYRAQHKKNDDKKGAADDVVATAQAQKVALAAVRADPGFDQVKDHITLKQAIECKQRGIAFADCRFDLYNDTNADEVDDAFGSGMANSVAKIEYGNGDTLVFKGERVSDEGVQLSAASAIGIDAKAPHNGNRNIATLAVAELLGQPIVPKVCYGMHTNPNTGEQEIGLLMSMAPGKTITTNDPITGVKKRREMWTPGNPPSATAQAKLMEQLTSLDWSDVITGQMDRHGGNYMVDINGDDVTVTGIDNDVCFGAQQTDPNANKGQYFSRTTPPGMPPLIDKAVYDRIIASDFDRDLRPKFESLMTAAEVTAAESRFNLTKTHAAGLYPDFVVADWTAWRSPGLLTAKAFLAAAGTGVGSDKSGGLFGRDFAAAFQREGIL